MNPLNLPFDTEEILAGLRPWIECESPTWDASAVSRMMALAARDLTEAGATVETIPGTGGFGDSIRATFPHPDQGQPGILVSGHLDTVHPIGTLEKLPFRRENGLCYGPGIQDMKGGNYVYLEAMRQIIKAGLQTPLPVTFLFTPDEEVGTPSTRQLIEDEARNMRAVLVPEPAKADGGAVIGRYAIARFNLLTKGRPSHAGWALKEGRSAIAAMAKKILEIEAMTTEDCTFSVGVIHAGQWVNCVSSECRAEALSMAKTQEDLDRGIAAMEALQSEENGVAFEVTRGVTRPVWSPDKPGTLELYDIAKSLSAEIGFELSAGSAGGGSDGNFTGAMGVPTLDSIGLRGQGLHTLNEHIEIDSLTERARLAAGLLMTIT
ncbi:M20/M25/M40 family metallo-hydrolase [Paracoccus saliphilus]|uniref:Glutamate carboxypeptidase n=1 Tax=Paracoccus saliphilus TaxID=405559 RepID=A0AA46A5T5_9RHOB|nr:M20/M25/M40 family metallo-hydrolase [Paracoccus saliphilus]WCR04580.1 M20/M25/M40 family metallo-hydrolase [Paracoccus saliphilus]SIS87041.1 glutamate carboxypeptidase [Paracoccus saliphilus]